MHPALNVKNYANDGFVKVCNVVLLTDDSWMYENINYETMFKDHRSWVYFIVVDDEIVKVGETGNPLGIESGTRFRGWKQPLTGTTSRFGRYRKGDNTDAYIRKSLELEAIEGRVSLWAKECPLVESAVTIQGKEIKTKSSIHKSLELDILKFILEQKCWPKLNKSMK